MEDGSRTMVAKRPHWLAILLGRMAERICPYAKAPCPEENCKIREFCKCAQEQAAAARRLENRLWGTLAVCGVAAIVFWFLKI